MTTSEFFAKYNGKYVDWDSAYGPQCVDLIRQYLLEVLRVDNSAIKPVSGAKDMYEKYDTLVDHDIFERIPNTPKGVPKEGDIMLWGTGSYGHVAVFIEGDINSFRSFDQNYPVGTPCHVQNHTSYAGVLGWLRCRATPDIQAQLDMCRVERDRNWNWFTQICDALGVGANVDAAVNEVKKLIGNDDALVQKDSQIQEAQTKIQDLESRIDTLQRNNQKLNGQIGEQQRLIDDLDKEIEEAKKGVSAPVLTGWRKWLYDLLIKT